MVAGSSFVSGSNADTRCHLWSCLLMSSVDTDLIKQKCTYAEMLEPGGRGQGEGHVSADFDKSVDSSSICGCDSIGGSATCWLEGIHDPWD